MNNNEPIPHPDHRGDEVKLVVEFEGPYSTGEQDECIAYFKAIPGMVCTGKTKQVAFNELMLSLAIKILYDSGINDIKPTTESPDHRGKESKDWKEEFRMLLIDYYDIVYTETDVIEWIEQHKELICS